MRGAKVVSSDHVAGEPVAADRSGVESLLGLSARLLWKALAERLDGLGLDASAYIVLVNVAIIEERQGRGPLVSEMIQHLVLNPGDADAAVGRLTRLGLLDTTPEAGSAHLTLLEKGRTMMPVVQNEVAGFSRTCCLGSPTTR